MEKIQTPGRVGGSRRSTPPGRRATRNSPSCSVRTGRRTNRREPSNSLLLGFDVRVGHFGRGAAAQVLQPDLDLRAEELQHLLYARLAADGKAPDDWPPDEHGPGDQG